MKDPCPKNKAMLRRARHLSLAIASQSASNNANIWNEMFSQPRPDVSSLPMWTFNNSGVGDGATLNDAQTSSPFRQRFNAFTQGGDPMVYVGETSHLPISTHLPGEGRPSLQEDDFEQWFESLITSGLQ